MIQGTVTAYRNTKSAKKPSINPLHQTKAAKSVWAQWPWGSKASTEVPTSQQGKQKLMVNVITH